MGSVMLYILLLIVDRIYGVVHSQNLSEADWFVENGNHSILVEAKIPGGIYTDLQKSGRLPNELYYKFNDVTSRWVAYDNWTYYTIFTAESHILGNTNIKLILHGVDTVSNIYLNDQLIGKTDNMFVRYTFDVSSILKEGKNTIKIEFESPVAYAKKQHEDFYKTHRYSIFPICHFPSVHGECHVNMIRKTQSSFGWDWGPAFPTVGIWKPLELLSFNSAVIQDVQVTTARGNAGPSWTVNILVTLIMAPLQAANGTFVISLDRSENILPAEISSDSSGTAHHQMSFDTQNMQVHLWWPNGYGDQPLYDVNVTFTDSTGTETSSKIVRIGFRTIELIQDTNPNKTSESFYFKINDVPIFMKGSNWIPADSFHERISPDYIKHLLQSSKDANMNMLRVWGGGNYESDFFYDTADQMGILIWQDMMFAYSMYPATLQFLSSVQTEITQQIERLQHHPSIAIWCGNNENELYLSGYKYNIFYFGHYKTDYIKLYVNTVGKIAKELDPTRPFVISSPTNGKKSIDDGYISSNPNEESFGDAHFYNYFINGWQWQNYPTPRFASEYGFQSWPSIETLVNISTSDDWDIFSSFSRNRQHALFGNLLLLFEIGMNLHLPKSKVFGRRDPVKEFKDTIYLSQINQAMSIKTETEHYRRHQNEHWTMGALYWQLQDIWQAPSWASIEYGGKWKMLHYYAVKFFSPLLVTCTEDNNIVHVHAVSDHLEEIRELNYYINIRRWGQIEVPGLQIAGQIEMQPQQSTEIFQEGISSLFQKANCSEQECFVIATLTEPDDSILASDLFFPVTVKSIRGLQKPTLKISNVTSIQNLRDDVTATFEFTITTKAIALFVWLEAEGIRGRFSDNGFHLTSSQIKCQFFAWQETTLAIFAEKITITSLTNIY